MCRNWKKRIKGRDWYDFVWYVGNNVPVKAIYLKEKLLQSGIKFKTEEINKELITNMLVNKINEVDFNAAKSDVLPFIKDSAAVDLWSKDFFKQIVEKMQIV